MSDPTACERAEAEQTIRRLAVAGEALGHRIMRLFFAGGLVVTVMLALVSAGSDAGPNPARRFALLGAVLIAWIWAVRKPVAAADALRNSSWPVLGLAATLIMAGAIDGGLHDSILQPEAYIVAGIAVVSGGGRRLLMTSGLLTAGLLATLPLGYGSRRLFTESVLSELVTLWGATIVLVAFVAVWRSTCASAFDRVAAARAGAPTLTPVLSAAITGVMAPMVLPAATESLSPAEVEVVRQLARGLAAKQIARTSHRSVYTVRAHIREAKRKTGARTIPQLVVLAGDAAADETRA